MSGTAISAAELYSLNDISLLERAKDFSNYSFWHYTRLKTADIILQNGCFRIGNLTGMNDLDEIVLHKNEVNKVFSTCFCNSDTEKIPLWYLYSGLDGKGAALGITPARMLKWINFIKTVKNVEGVKNGQGKGEGTILTIGTDVELRYGWVYYQKTQEPHNIFYRNKWYTVDDPAAFEKGNYFIKSYPWEYEREFRLLFINKTKADYDAIFIDIPNEIRENIKVMLAPELTQAKFDSIKDLKYINAGLMKRLSRSTLSIRMNLLSRNRENLLDFLNEELALPSSSFEVDRICKVIQNASRCSKQ